jgi:predicted nucleotidyltransferase
MINKISPRPSLLKRGREKAEMTHSITRRALIINAIKEVMEKDSEVLFAYLYGSSVYFDRISGGDIDVAVYLKTLDMMGYLKKEEELIAALVNRIHSNRIDLRILNVSPFLLQYHVIKEGVPILVRDEAERVGFEIKVMNRFFELKPYLDEYRQMLSSRIRTG